LEFAISNKPHSGLMDGKEAAAPFVGPEGISNWLVYRSLVKEQLGDAVVSSFVRGDVFESCSMRSWANHSLTRVIRDGKEIGGGVLCLGVPLLDDVTLRRGRSMRRWPRSSLTGVECT
jgi:hypothetical protein